MMEGFYSRGILGEYSIRGECLGNFILGGDFLEEIKITGGGFYPPGIFSGHGILYISSVICFLNRCSLK